MKTDDDGKAGRSGISLFRSLFQRKLVWSLLFWFLCISLVPLVTVSYISSQSARKSLEYRAEEELTSVAELIAGQLGLLFSRSVADLAVLSHSKSTRDMLNDLRLSYEPYGSNPSEFVRSSEWRKLKDYYKTDLAFFGSAHGYRRLFLIDIDGNILFSTEVMDDVGTNVFSGKYSKTLFGKACRNSLEENGPVFSDFEFYAPSDNDPAAFVAPVIKAQKGETIGLIALQFSQLQIDGILQERTGLGKTGETYLVGNDLRMRSNSVLEGNLTMLTGPIESEQTRRWREAHVVGSAPRHVEEKAQIYLGRRGVPVIGAHHHLEFLGVPLAVIAETETEEAFAYITQLQKYTTLLLILTGTLVFAVSFLVARRIVEPVKALSGWASRITGGDLEYLEIDAPNNEIGELYRSFGKVVDSYRSITAVCEAIAIGDLNRAIALRSGHDKLGESMNTMAESLREVVRQINAIACGDYSAEIVPRSDNDELGAAVCNMTEVLREVSTSNERALEEARRLVSYLDILPTPVMTIDKDFTITYLNPKGAEYADRPLKDCIGRKCYDLFATPHCHSAQCRAVLAMSGDETAIGENVIEPGGKNIPIQYTAAPVKDADGNIIGALECMIDITAINQAMEEIGQRNWVSVGQAELSERISGNQDFPTLAQKAVSFLAPYLDAQVGAIFIYEDQFLKLAGSYACSERRHTVTTFKLGEGLVGQAALEKKTIVYADIPHEYIKIRSGLGEAVPRNILMVPLLCEGELKGVMELGSSHEFTDLHRGFLEQVAENIAIAGDLALSRTRMKEFLEKTQHQAAELQAQQEELRVTNEELEERTKALEMQQAEVKRKNLSLEESRRRLEEKSKALELSNKYKSEFLANMSHELRSPLNSMLLLAQTLGDNKEGNLTAKQMEYASTIHGSGKELLALINDILDLSKIEAGRQDLHVERVGLDELYLYVKRNFEHQAEEKGLALEIKIEEELPEALETDRQKVEQVIKNLMSNALKFTREGRISFRIVRPSVAFDGSEWSLVPDRSIAIAVSDTGTGIPKEKQRLIFEAFQQADGSTSRKYGGTGLGLSISRELAKLLGGGIGLESEEGRGSTFTIYLPEKIRPRTTEKVSGTEKGPPRRRRTDYVPIQYQRGRLSAEILQNRETISDDRERVAPRDRSLLIIEDDPRFAKIVLEQAHEKGFKVLAVSDGETGLRLAAEYQPSAIILDIGLPGINGWVVMEALKNSYETRDIPVHIISALDEDNAAMRMGAVGFVSKPVSREGLDKVFEKIETMMPESLKSLLIVEGDEDVVALINRLVSSHDVEISAAATGREALELLRSRGFDCMVLDPTLPDMSGFELLDTLKNDETFVFPPVIVYTGMALSREEEQRLQQYAQSIMIKGAVSKERLLGEITLFLHQVDANLADGQQETMRKVYDREEFFKDKCILIVDDDARNVFALSQILEEKGLRIEKAFNGKEALQQLAEHPEIDLVLMDIMMPEMDGYETMRAIRKNESYKRLPVIALTAKAMKEDRHKCIQAGATDYLPKPVDVSQLLSLIRVWLSQ
jgi:PAS domain S-box-containing protein